MGHLIMHGWHMIMDSAAYIAEQMQIESAIDVVDWISRAEFVASKMRLSDNLSHGRMHINQTYTF